MYFVFRLEQFYLIIIVIVLFACLGPMYRYSFIPNANINTDKGNDFSSLFFDCLV